MKGVTEVGMLKKDVIWNHLPLRNSLYSPGAESPTCAYEL